VLNIDKKLSYNYTINDRFEQGRIGNKGNMGNRGVKIEMT
jgi:hypothetical protein